MEVAVMVAVSVTGVSVGSGSRVAVSVGTSVDVKVIVAVSGIGVWVSVGSTAVAVADSNLGVLVGRTMGRMVGTSPIQAARIPPSAPMIAARIMVLVADEFFSVMEYS